MSAAAVKDGEIVERRRDGFSCWIKHESKSLDERGIRKAIGEMERRLYFCWVSPSWNEPWKIEIKSTSFSCPRDRDKIRYNLRVGYKSSNI